MRSCSMLLVDRSIRLGICISKALNHLFKKSDTELEGELICDELQISNLNFWLKTVMTQILILLDFNVHNPQT